MTSQRQDFCDQDTIQHEYLDKLGMRYPYDKDCDPFKQEHYRQRQENPKLKNGQTTKGIKTLRKKCTESKNKLQKLHDPTLIPSTNTADSSIIMTITQ